jgi:nicotinamidase-related amidase
MTPYRLFWLLLASLALLVADHSAPLAAEAPSWLVASRRVARSADGKSLERVEETAAWQPSQTAIVIVDMWDDHHCKSAAARVAEMAPKMNEVVKAARDQGVLIIHAPSDCMDFYKDAPGRKTAQQAPLAAASVKFQWNYFDPQHEGPLAEKLEKGGCSCDTPEPCSPSYRAWKRQIATIEIDQRDAISADGQEIYNLLADRGIQNVIVMGVHTNRCVLGRPFGIRQMVYLGKNVVLCRDLTDSYHRDPGAHFEGRAKIIDHIEQYWCPSITSQSITGQPPFRFAGDKRDEHGR